LTTILTINFCFQVSCFYYFLQLKFDHHEYGVDWSGIMVSTRIGTRIQIHLDHGPCDDQIPIWEKSEKNKTKQNKIWSQKVDKCFFLKHRIDDKIFGFNFWHQNSVKIRHHKTNKLCSQKVGKCFFSKTWIWSLMTKYFLLIFEVKILWKFATRNQEEITDLILVMDDCHTQDKKTV